MNVLQQLKLAMWVRLLNFFMATPFGDGPADQIVARFKEKVARQQALVAQQRNGEDDRAVHTGRYQGVRRRIGQLVLRHLAGVAASLKATHPDLAGAIVKPVHGLDAQSFLAVMHSIATVIQTEHDLLRANGMAEETLPTLTALLTEYEQAVSDADAARRAHTGARGMLRSEDKELMVLVHQLDGLVVFHHRDKQDVLSAWKSARNIAWPVKPAATLKAGQDGQVSR